MIKKRYLMIIGFAIGIFIAVSILQTMADAAVINDLTIQVKDVRLADVGLISCDLLVTVNFTNPASRALSIVSARFDVFVADSYVGKSSVQHLSIPSKSSKEHVISLTLLYSDVARAVLEGITNRNFDIDVSGEAQGYVFYDLFIVSVPFSLSSTYP